tara:strand:- start:33819 stop:34799 length:981 start_codon:yes stop_codon:yes gene_type:complete
MSSESIFITGATGFLGSTLSRALLKRGHRVVASGRRPDRLKVLQDGGADILQYDLSRQLTPALPECGYMVHCAALSAPWGRKSAFEQANIDGTRGAIALARAMGVHRLVHISTPSVYFRFADQDRVREDAALPKPVNAYAQSKRVAEALICAAPDLSPIILRPRGLYGRGDVALLPRLLQTAAQRPLPFMRDGAAATDLTHVDDVVSAVMAALEAPGRLSGQVFNISGGAALPVTDVVNAACAHVGIQARWRSLPFRLVKTYAQLSESLSRIQPSAPEPPITAYGVGLFAFRQTLDISNAQTHLGWRPAIGFEEGLERTFGDGASC